MNKVRMDDICDFYNGGAWSDKEYVGSGLPVLKVSNCKNSGFRIEEVNFLPISLKEKYAKNKLYKGDVIIATVGSHPNLIESAAGRSCVVNSLVEGFYLNQNAVCLRTKDEEILDQGYLGYLCKERSFQHFIQNKGRGAANQMRIAIGGIKEYEFNLPDIDIQRRISAILIAYDDLIENNQKQIKLLEEAAQRLYKEWFVKLRFPGYEDVAIVNGVPEGWRYKRVEEFGEVITGKTPSTSKTEYYGGNIPFVTIPDMHGNVFPLVTEKTLTKVGADTQKNKYLPVNSVIVSCIATVGLVNIAVEACQTNQQINSVILQNDNELYFFYESMKRIKALLDGVGSNGATMTNVNKTKFSSIKVLYPAEDLVKRYNELCKPIFDKIFALSKSIIKAEQARDRLLPKLMSGEIKV